MGSTSLLSLSLLVLKALVRYGVNERVAVQALEITLCVSQQQQQL